ncbi:MAG: helix-turn-helix domain containing protein [Gordonia paraffinivorans]
MARPQKFTVEEIVDGARDVALERWREATVADVAARVGAPVGSIYHRFPSRDALFGAAWARAIRRFHAGLIEVGRRGDAQEALLAQARHIPRFCRGEPAEAKAMSLYRLTDLLDLVPAADRAELSTINDEIDALSRDLTARRFGRVTDRRLTLVRIATRQGPYGLVRPLVGQTIPQEYDAVCAASAAGILALGD